MVPFTTRLKKRNKAALSKLAAYEGTDIEKVTNKILELFFQGVGDIPERKSLLDSWPGQLPDLGKRPRKKT